MTQWNGVFHPGHLGPGHARAPVDLTGDSLGHPGGNRRLDSHHPHADPQGALGNKAFPVLAVYALHAPGRGLAPLLRRIRPISHDELDT